MSEIVEDKVSVFRIAPSEVAMTWDLVVPFFEKVFADAKTHTADDVRDILLAQQAQFWIQWNISKQTIDAAFVTEFVRYPRGVWLRLWLGGARSGSKVNYYAVRGALTYWAEKNSCKGFEIIGRHGWLRKFPEAVVEGLCMRLTF